MQDTYATQKRFVLQSYEQQLMVARRLTRYKVKMRLAEGLAADDPDPAPKRRAFASKVTQELFDSLMFYPSSSPVVDELRADLSRALGRQVQFSYPPGEKLQLLVQDTHGYRPLNEEEQTLALSSLRAITSQKVDKSMFRQPAQKAYAEAISRAATPPQPDNPGDSQ